MDDDERWRRPPPPLAPPRAYNLDQMALQVRSTRLDDEQYLPLRVNERKMTARQAELRLATWREIELLLDIIRTCEDPKIDAYVRDRWPHGACGHLERAADPSRRPA